MPGVLRDMVAVGAPGVLATWGFDLLREACARLDPEVDIRDVDRDDAVEGLGIAAGRPRILCLSQFTSPSLRAAMAAGVVPIVAFLDDPVDSVRYLKFASECTTMEALRAQTAATAGYAFLFANRQALLIPRASPRGAREIVRRILDHLQFDRLAPDYEAVVGEFSGADDEAVSLEAALARKVAGYEPPESAALSLASGELQCINDALAPIVRMAGSAEAAPIVWPTAVFFSGDQPGEPASLVADMTGAARILYYGPYLHLPSGAWTVRMMVGFSDGARGTPLSIEVHCERLLAHATMQPAGKGVFHASFQFAHDAPQDAIEIRLSSDRGAIDGRLALGRVEFTRRPDGDAAPPVAGRPSRG